MKKIIFLIAAAILLLAGGLGILRLVIGGDEDTWICVEGQWLKHGNPQASMPADNCGQ